MRQIVCLVVPGIMLLIVLTVFLRRFVNDVNNVLGIIKRDDLWHEVIVVSQLIGIFVVAVYLSLNWTSVVDLKFSLEDWVTIFSQQFSIDKVQRFLQNE